MLEPSSSEEDSDVENDTWLTRTQNTDTTLKPPAPHQNGGLRSGSPHVVDGSKPGPGGVKPIDRAGSPSPSVSSEKTLTGAELAVGDVIFYCNKRDPLVLLHQMQLCFKFNFNSNRRFRNF